MKRFILLVAVLAAPVLLTAQKVALKNNLVWDATLSPNLALEVALAPKVTLDLYGAVNPFNFHDNKRFKHWLVQPEFRFWICERFNGSFFGVHGHGGTFLVKNLRMPFGLLKELRDSRYEGHFVGAGVSYGYQWMLGRRWGLEASVGVGYARFVYDVYSCDECPTKLDSRKENYFGPTKLALSFMFFLK